MAKASKITSQAIQHLINQGYSRKEAVKIIMKQSLETEENEIYYE